MKNELWEQWNEIHEEADQKKRQKSAEGTPCTPLSIDVHDFVGTFQGSHGHYLTSLEHCTCIDFNRRKLPCKHMYRLAMELGKFSGNFKSNIKDIKRVKNKGLKIEDAVELIEELTTEEQKFLWPLLYSDKPSIIKTEDIDTYKAVFDKGFIEESMPIDYDIILESFSRNELNDHIIKIDNNIMFKKNMSLENLLSWIYKNIPQHIPKICEGYTTIIISDNFLKSRFKMYKYLNRIYEQNDLSWLETSLGFTIEKDFPDDEITALMIKHGRI